MSRRPARVTQKEVENAVRGFEATGKRAVEIRILPDGTIVVSSESANDANAAYGASVLDERLLAFTTAKKRQ